MRPSPLLITIAGGILVSIQFLTGATELDGLLSEHDYAIAALALGAIGAVCTWLLRDQAITAQQHYPENPDDREDLGDREDLDDPGDGTGDRPGDRGA